MEQKEAQGLAQLLASFGTRINDLEQSMALLKQKVGTIVSTALNNQEKTKADVDKVKEHLRGLQEELANSKEITQHLLNLSEEFARKEELEAIEQQLGILGTLNSTDSENLKQIISLPKKRQKKRK